MTIDPRAPGVVIPDDLTPWPGGPTGPSDYDGDYVLMADGGWGHGNSLPGTWSVTGVAGSTRGPIIAYRKLKRGAVSPKQKEAAVRGAILMQAMSRW